MSWSNMFNEFKIKFLLNDEQMKIENWIDFKYFNDDITLFMHSPNEKKESGGHSNSKRDQILECIIRFDEEKARAMEIERAISLLSDDDKKLFYSIYVDNVPFFKITTDWRIKEKLLVKIASNDPDFVYNNDILSEFNNLLCSFNSALKDRFDFYHSNFDSLCLVRTEYIPLSWSSSFDRKSKGYIKTKLLIFALLFDENFISLGDFKCLCLTCQMGKKYFKFVTSNI